MDIRRTLAVLAQPTRFRIVALLAAAPRTVGEVARSLGTLQPQTTKHLQALASADLVVVHRLGRRRVATLRRDTLRELAEWFDRLAITDPSESVLDEYREAIAAEETRLVAGASGDRTIHIGGLLPGSADRVWRAWTEAEFVRRWWAPEHFEVSGCEVQPAVGGTLQIVMREADGAEYTAMGTFLELKPPQGLRFTLSPLGADSTPLFSATYEVSFAERSGQTEFTMTIDVADVVPKAAPAVAGIEIGWRQTLDRLAELLASDDDR